MTAEVRVRVQRSDTSIWSLALSEEWICLQSMNMLTALWICLQSMNMSQNPQVLGTGLWYKRESCPRCSCDYHCSPLKSLARKFLEGLHLLADLTKLKILFTCNQLKTSLVPRLSVPCPLTAWVRDWLKTCPTEASPTGTYAMPVMAVTWQSHDSHMGATYSSINDSCCESRKVLGL